MNYRLLAVCRVLLLYGLLSAFFSVSSNAQDQKAIIEVKGVVLREDSLSPIYGAVVYNKTSLLGTLTNKIGNFKMRVKNGDTLIISHLGYVTELFVFPNTEVIDPEQKLVFTMQVRSYELPGIDVRRFRIRRKEKPISMRRQDNITYSAGTIRFEGGYYYNLPYNYSNQYTPNLIPSFGVPIGDWAEMKRQQQILKVAELEAIDRRKNVVQVRYNRAFVQKLTGLRGNELENFMNFCKPTDEQVLKANEYELTYFVLECYDKFKAEND